MRNSYLITPSSLRQSNYKTHHLSYVFTLWTPQYLLKSVYNTALMTLLWYYMTNLISNFTKLSVNNLHIRLGIVLSHVSPCVTVSAEHTLRLKKCHNYLSNLVFWIEQWIITLTWKRYMSLWDKSKTIHVCSNNVILVGWIQDNTHLQ